MVLRTRFIVSNTIKNTVLAMDNINDVIIRGQLDFFKKLYLQNHIELTKYPSKNMTYIGEI